MKASESELALLSDQSADPAPLGWATRQWFRQLAACRLCRNVTLAVFVAILVIETLILVPSYRNYEEDLLRQYEAVARQGIATFLASTNVSKEPAAAQALLRATGLLGIDMKTADGSQAAGEPVGQAAATDGKLRDIPRPAPGKLDLLWSNPEWAPDWEIAARLDISELSGELWAFVFRILGLSLLIALFVTLVTMSVLGRMMLAPLLRLRHRILQAGEDAAHPLHYVRQPERCDEFGEVAGALNKMLVHISTYQDRLQVLNEELDKLVDQRTRSLKATEKELHIRSWYDQLTGLANRALFEEHLRNFLRHAETESAAGVGALLMLGLDNFQTINGLAGHAAGDRMLQEIAHRLSHYAQEKNLVARLGGDVFALLLPHMSGADPQKLQREIEAITGTVSQPVIVSGQELQCDVSVGVALIPTDGQDAPTLLQHAEIAMQKAKAVRENSIHFFSKTLSQQVRQRQTLLTELKSAIPQGQLKLHFQPQCDAVRDCVGYEVLIRWDHPSWGPIPPSHFIPLAEDSHLILTLGDWILEQAIVQAKRWIEEGFHGRVAVNLSAQQFAKPGLVDEISELLTQHRFPANQLELEITETAFMGDIDRAITIMQQIRALGVQLAVDDFGTGYSSLAYLKLLPVNRIKIDRAFVKELPANQQDLILCRTIITMAHNMGCQVIAEGVETEEQATCLLDAGCDELQGYLLGKPGPVVLPPGAPKPKVGG
ncbi:MAG: EAL domain-containing protein [Marinobacter sp.]|uniref:putative bifunctional diguanylate cyclase/phosphodiesterase n=1 Tax=Marinobacter sp. TaxID=50741 RepID=UPI00299D361D|nr:EAL domain-containing protein [Marinobacter sp.]MDX1756196.1 EAL domain-containing protein [Marinobacter sp.]